MLSLALTAIIVDLATMAKYTPSGLLTLPMGIRPRGIAVLNLLTFAPYCVGMGHFLQNPITGITTMAKNRTKTQSVENVQTVNPETPNNETENTMTQTEPQTQSPAPMGIIRFSDLLATVGIKPRNIPTKRNPSGQSSSAKKRIVPIYNPLSSDYSIGLDCAELTGQSVDGWTITDSHAQSDWLNGPDGLMAIVAIDDTLKSIGDTITDGTAYYTLFLPSGSNADDVRHIFAGLSHHRTALHGLGMFPLGDKLRELGDECTITQLRNALPSLHWTVGTDDDLNPLSLTIPFHVGENVNTFLLDTISVLHVLMGIVQRSFQRTIPIRWDSDPVERSGKRDSTPGYVPFHDDGDCRFSLRRLLNRLGWNKTASKTPATPFFDVQLLPLVKQQLAAMAGLADGVGQSDESENVGDDTDHTGE